MYVFAGCGGFVAVGMIGTCVLLAAMTGGAEGGTRYANNMERYALRHIQEHRLLEPGESIVAYNDASLSLDGSQSVIVTDRRLVYHFQGTTSSIALAEIAQIEHVDEGAMGDVIDVFGSGGEHIHIEIAPWNGGPAFLAALERQRDRAQDLHAP